MELYVKIFNGNLIRVFNTAIDKKKRIVITTINDFQEEAEVEFYVKNKKVKTLLFTNLPPAKARVLNIPVAIELIDKETLIFSYKGTNKIENTIKFDISDIREKSYTKPVLISVIAILIVTLFIVGGILFLPPTVHSFSNINLTTSTNLITSTTSTSVKYTEQDTTQDQYVVLQFDSTKDTYNEQQEQKSEFTFNSLISTVNENTPLYFIKDKAVLRDDESSKISRIIDYAKNYSSISILIKGHTADIGVPSREKKLSIQRAKLIKKYLMARLSNVTVEIEGMGSTEKAIINPAKSKRWLNRRVEIIVNSVE